MGSGGGGGEAEADEIGEIGIGDGRCQFAAAYIRWRGAKFTATSGSVSEGVYLSQNVTTLPDLTYLETLKEDVAWHACLVSYRGDKSKMVLFCIAMTCN